jgi:hypothetical protein
MEREQYKGLVIRLEQDQDCENPLDNDAGAVFVTYRKGARSCYGNTPLDQEEHEEVGRRINAGELVGLPVYVYEHGGCIIRAAEGNPFSCPWDSGQSGYIYVTKKTALEWYGGKVLTKGKREKTLQQLRGIVDTYSQWCNGECYGFIIEDQDGEQLDSCWGYIGADWAMQAGKESADYHADKIQTDKRTAWRTALHEARERHYWQAREVLTVGGAA